MSELMKLHDRRVCLFFFWDSMLPDPLQGKVFGLTCLLYIHVWRVCVKATNFWQVFTANVTTENQTLLSLEQKGIVLFAI